MIYAIKFMNTKDLCIKSFCNLDHIALVELACKLVVFDYTVCILIPNNITFHLLSHSFFIHTFIIHFVMPNTSFFIVLGILRQI